MNGRREGDDVVSKMSVTFRQRPPYKLSTGIEVCVSDESSAVEG
jgi:hypothetical protein